MKVCLLFNQSQFKMGSGLQICSAKYVCDIYLVRYRDSKAMSVMPLVFPYYDYTCEYYVRSLERNAQCLPRPTYHYFYPNGWGLATLLNTETCVCRIIYGKGMVIFGCNNLFGRYFILVPRYFVEFADYACKLESVG